MRVSPRIAASAIAPLGIFALLAALTAPACGSSSSTPAGLGGERQGCFANGTCNAGLTCLSQTCVYVDAGPDAPIGSFPHKDAASNDGAGDDAESSGDANDQDGTTPCDPVAQSGCSGGDKCTIDGSGAPTCLATGSKASGEICGAESVDDCVAGALCTDDGTGITKICRAFCATDDECTQPAASSGATLEPKNIAHCLLVVSGHDACTFACNPVAKAGASGCAAPLGCEYFGTATISEATDCTAGGAAVEGATCTSSGDCVAGLACGSGHCRAVCRAGIDADCATAGDTCTPPAIANPMFGYCCPASGC